MNKNVIAVSCVAALGAGATGIVGAANAQDATPTVTITASSKRATIAGADALKAGPTRLVINATRAGERGMIVFKVRDGVTREQLSRAVPRIEDPYDAERYGGYVASAFVAKGGSYTTTVNLPAAEYAVIDFSSRRAALRGFFTVGAEAGTAVAPAPDVTVRMSDFRFSGPSTLPRNGVIQVTNDGKKLHHMLAFPLRKGINNRRFLRDVRRGADSVERAFAGEPTSIVEIVSPETENRVQTQLRPGKTLLVCFVQDAPRQKPHSARGMAKIVTVR